MKVTCLVKMFSDIVRFIKREEDFAFLATIHKHMWRSSKQSNFIDVLNHVIRDPLHLCLLYHFPPVYCTVCLPLLDPWSLQWVYYYSCIYIYTFCILSKVTCMTWTWFWLYLKEVCLLQGLPVMPARWCSDGWWQCQVQNLLVCMC